jgi:hypothetical protein
VPTTIRQQFLHVIDARIRPDDDTDSAVFPPWLAALLWRRNIGRYDGGVLPDKPQEDRNDAAQNFPPIYLERFARAAG